MYNYKSFSVSSLFFYTNFFMRKHFFLYPFSVGAGESSTVGHACCSHKHVSCHVVHLCIQALCVGGLLRESVFIIQVHVLSFT